MLAKKNRIPRKLFKNLLEEKRYFNSPHFSLRVAHSTDNARIAVSVSKKVSKKAVDRNKLRRRAYATVLPMVKDLRNKFYLISAKPGAEKLKMEQLREEIMNLLSKSQ